MQNINAAFTHFKNFLSSGLVFRTEPYYRIVGVNISTQEMSFRIKGKAVLLKCKFSEAVADADIISGLLPTDACWLGGYYGRVLIATIEGRDKIKKIKSLGFLLENPTAQYQVVFLNRSGSLVYLDKKTGQEFTELPLSLVSKPNIISKFDSTQACYIGILAGVEMGKNGGKIKNLTASPFEPEVKSYPPLRIVK